MTPKDIINIKKACDSIESDMCETFETARTIKGNNFAMIAKLAARNIAFTNAVMCFVAPQHKHLALDVCLDHCAETISILVDALGLPDTPESTAFANEACDFGCTQAKSVQARVEAALGTS